MESFTFEVTCDAVTYVYAGIVGTVRADKVVFELNTEDLACTRKVTTIGALPQMAASFATDGSGKPPTPSERRRGDAGSRRSEPHAVDAPEVRLQPP